MKEKNGNRLRSRTEVQRRYNISKRFLELAVARGDGPRFVRIGRLVRYRDKDILDWIEANSVGGGE